MDYRRALGLKHSEVRRNFAGGANDPGSLPDKVLRDRRVPRSFEKLNRFFEDVDHAIDFFARVVEIKTGAGGAGHAESPHERLIAMMTTAHGEAVAVGECGQVVRVGRVHDETNHAGAILRWSEHAQSRQLRHSLERILCKIDIVLKNLGASDS